jgi:molybdenum cofactor cytidylyltransferase
MGRPKLSLPLTGDTVLGQVVKSLVRGGVEDVLVVIGPHVTELAPLAETAGAKVLRLDAETPDMRATITHGLRWLQQQRQPTEEDYWLLCPADHPTVQAEVVRSLITSTGRDHSIIVPTFEGRRGHPSLIGWRHVEAIRQLPADVGLNSFLRAHECETLLLPVASIEVLRDLDTPEDYHRVSKREVDQP